MENNKDNEDNILNEANHAIDIVKAKMSMKYIKDFIPMIVDFNKSLYDEMIKRGFNELQAFQFSCEFTLKQFSQQQQ